MAQYVYTMNRVGKIVPPKRHILKDISLSFFPGAKIGVLGLNGAGKSTLLRIMAGVDTDIEGEARPQPGIKIGYLPQEPKLNLEQTVREAVEEAVGDVKQALTRLDEVYALYADPDADFDKLAKEQGELEAIIQSHDGHNLDNQLERAADALRLPAWDAKIANLSGGERRRVAICRLLLEKPDMLLLDEPTNHLDAESVAWLERFLHDYEGTVVAITHDRYFLDNVAGWILELDRGEGIPWEGNYSSWLEQKDQRLAQEASAEAARRKSIEKELEWVRQGAKGRQSKGKARLARFEELNNTDYQKRNETSELFIPTRRSSDLPVAAAVDETPGNIIFITLIYHEVFYVNYRHRSCSDYGAGCGENAGVLCRRSGDVAGQPPWSPSTDVWSSKNKYSPPEGRIYPGGATRDLWQHGYLLGRRRRYRANQGRAGKPRAGDCARGGAAHRRTGAD